jgi:hypothetical protein
MDGGNGKGRVKCGREKEGGRRVEGRKRRRTERRWDEMSDADEQHPWGRGRGDGGRMDGIGRGGREGSATFLLSSSDICASS